MSTSDRAFNQVKAILGKLDRSIDAAREKRLHNGAVPVPPPVAQPVRPVAPTNGSVNGHGVNGSTGGGSGYGRATPIPSSRPRASGLERWPN